MPVRTNLSGYLAFSLWEGERLRGRYGQVPHGMQPHDHASQQVYIHNGHHMTTQMKQAIALPDPHATMQIVGIPTAILWSASVGLRNVWPVGDPEILHLMPIVSHSRPNFKRAKSRAVPLLRSEKLLEEV